MERCPCCKFLTITRRGDYDVCPVCFWEDDGQDDNNAGEVWGGPNYELSLTQARANYREYGCCGPRWTDKVRPPTKDESC